MLENRRRLKAMAVEPLIVVILVAGVTWYIWSRWIVPIRKGNLPFWKLAQKHPEAAYIYFLSEPCWFIDQVPTDIDQRELVGPFNLYIPSINRTVKIYGMHNEISESQVKYKK